MKHPFLRLLSVSALVSLLGMLACSSTTKTAAPDPNACDPAQCAPKNECIANGTDTKCRLPCAAHADCPFNYQCATNAARNYCVKMTTDIAQKPKGQWGTGCLPPGGETGNPACDAETGFACYGTGTTDATAYCTHFDCVTDLDCAGGFWCATINATPTVKTDKRSFGTTRTACLKRVYCSPCGSDVDCPVLDGKQTRCTDDDVGGKYCATPCTTTSNCRLDASCTGVAADGTKLCRPRAGACKGDGSICSPCRSDADCPDGFCLKGSYSPETFCSVKSTSACAPSAGASIVKGACPPFTGFAGTKIGCQSASGDENIPKDQCIGLIDFGESGDIACYTKH